MGADVLPVDAGPPVPDPMATTDPAAPPAPPARLTRWYQWVLVYPAVVLALLTAVPDWATKAEEIYQGLSGTNRTLAEAKRLDSLIRKNAECLEAPKQWVTTPNLRVDGTICPSGDLMVWVSKGEAEFLDFLEIDKVLASHQTASLFDPFSMQAFAGTEVPLTLAPKPMPELLLRVQEPFAITICQSFPDNRTLVRHLQVGAECYDETIDTYTGAVKSRVQVPCRTSC